MKYDSYRYIYPPRPENQIPKTSLKDYDKGGMFEGMFFAQPKYNGDCGPVFFNPKEFRPMNRHNKPLTKFKLNPNELRKLFPNKKWNMVVGEYMDKSQIDEKGKVFNHKFVIFDIIIYDGEYLLDTTYEERWLMLYNKFKNNIIGENEYAYQIDENIWLTKVFYGDFESKWESLTKIPMIEGLVLKKIKSKLQTGYQEKNNIGGLVKCRKPTKNYRY